MNRHDEIQAKARDIATNVHADPAAINAMADQLIELVGLMLNAQGKYLAGYGERSMNEVCDWTFKLDTMSIEYSSEDEAERLAEFEAGQRVDVAKYHGMYLTGEQMQCDIDEIVAECVNPRVDLERWNRITGNEWCVCGHSPKSHQDGICIGERHNKHACEGGTCTEFRAEPPTGGWVYVDRRPVETDVQDDCCNTDETAVAPTATAEARLSDIVEYAKSRLMGGHPTNDISASWVLHLAGVGEAPSLKALACARCSRDKLDQLCDTCGETRFVPRSYVPCCYGSRKAPFHVCHSHVGRCCFSTDDICPIHC